MAAHPVAYMVLASIGCWAVVSWLTGAATGGAVPLGVLGPLTVAAGAWLIMERTHTRAPERLPGLMIKLFAAKMVFFGAYVAAVVMLLSGGSVPFVLSFTATYTVLHVMEALYLRRLFSSRPAAPGR
jgi:hypothetical protein